MSSRSRARGIACVTQVRSLYQHRRPHSLSSFSLQFASHIVLEGTLPFDTDPYFHPCRQWSPLWQIIILINDWLYGDYFLFSLVAARAGGEPPLQKKSSQEYKLMKEAAQRRAQLKSK
eukprot:TRINITY_DN9411_c0_g2_i2.p2 TRINITY_DN9411_c0_g2~~TRINITY_DN9411_c0_g2_i2.p2  ORF type:complete len:118 (+),score=31.59 TRINITY_DN9411_c0_g2_i2:350-703(+)